VSSRIGLGKIRLPHTARIPNRIAGVPEDCKRRSGGDAGLRAPYPKGMAKAGSFTSKGVVVDIINSVKVARTDS
jgi:hypothetical protein